jgi:MOSC domain-containing protein YiiM
MRYVPFGGPFSLNVGTPHTVVAGSLEVRTAIWKHPVAGRYATRRHNLDGDRQADLTVDGGRDRRPAYASDGGSLSNGADLVPD